MSKHGRRSPPLDKAGVLVNAAGSKSSRSEKPAKAGFVEDFRRFFMRGLAALLPTLITIWLLLKVWEFLWEGLGRHLIWVIKRVWFALYTAGAVQTSPGYIGRWGFDLSGEPELKVKILGVTMAIVMVYVVGLVVGNIIGRTGWRLIELGLMRMPLVRAIYPAVKQVTDFVLADRKQKFQASRVVACKPHSNGIWSVGLVTGNGLKPLTQSVQREMVTVFIPSSPTVVSGYVVVVPRDEVVELPMTVEEALRLLVTGGVVTGLHGDMQTAGDAKESPAVPAPEKAAEGRPILP